MLTGEGGKKMHGKTTQSGDERHKHFESLPESDL